MVFLRMASGSFIPYANDWIYHLSLGWLYTPEISPAGTWLWSEAHGWIWTSSEAFPPFLSEYEQQLDLSHPHRIRKILLRLFHRIIRVSHRPLPQSPAVQRYPGFKIDHFMVESCTFFS